MLVRNTLLIRSILFSSYLISLQDWTFSQTGTDSAATSKPRRSIEAVRVTNPIVVDGLLTEAEWQRAGTSGFTQRDPNEGAEPTHKTDIWLAYDDAALYVAARMYDTAPESIISRIGRRDAGLNSDFLYVGLDSYHDRRTGFYFMVYASGTMTDGTIYNDEWEDNSWDGVWDVVTNVDDKGWTAEFRIPYSQLRFPKQDEYVWGINVARQIERSKERSDFVMVPKKESGWASRFADLTGIRNINPPARLEVLPYIVSGNKRTNQAASGDPFNDGNSFSGNVGADLKVGLGSNLTLNATVNPDFGQVEVDPAVVNLSQFETFYEEKRPFFIEGSNYYHFGFGGANSNWGFNWGNPEYFYSRRIGRAPQGSLPDSGYADVPDGTTILAAAKLTGKITEGWSLGTLHAFTQRELARVDDGYGKRYDVVAEPFSSYNVVRSQREFNQGKQALGFLGTAVLRDLNEPYLVDRFNRRSYAFGLDGWTFLDPDQMFVLTGWLSTTRVEGTSDRMMSLQKGSLHYFQRPDALHVDLDSNATSMVGYAGRLALNKQKGNFIFNAALGLITPGFETNDLGFLFHTDVINMHVVLGYNWFEPDGFFRRKGFNISTFRNFTFGEPSSPGGAPRLFGGLRTGDGYFLSYNAQFMNYWSIHGNLVFNPATYDTRNTRGGPITKNTNQYSHFFNINSDGRKDIVFGGGLQTGRSESGGYRYSPFGWVEVKPSPGVSITLSPEYSRDNTIAMWVGRQNDPTATRTYGTRYVFAKLDQKEFSSSVRVDWTFTPKLSLQLYLQPLISVGRYDQFKELREPGAYAYDRYDAAPSSITYVDSTDSYFVDPDGTGANTFTLGNPDFNFKSLRGNAVLRWEYLPGSTLYFVWTHSGTNSRHPGEFDFNRDFSDMLFSPEARDDAFLIKLTYWWHP